MMVSWNEIKGWKMKNNLCLPFICKAFKTFWLGNAKMATLSAYKEGMIWWCHWLENFHFKKWYSFLHFGDITMIYPFSQRSRSKCQKTSRTALVRSGINYVVFFINYITITSVNIFIWYCMLVRVSFVIPLLK